MTSLRTLPRAVAGTAFALLLILAVPARAQFTYGAPDYDYDRGWYGTNNWYDQYHHYGYIYNTAPWGGPRYFTTPTGEFDHFNPWSVFNDFDAFEDEDSLFSF